MKRGGNKWAQWWTCQLCRLRWERRPLEHGFGTRGAATRLSLVTRGRYQGHTYDEVMNLDYTYCQWILATAQQETSAEMEWVSHFAAYIISVQENMMDVASRVGAFPDNMEEHWIDEEDTLLQKPLQNYQLLWWSHLVPKPVAHG